MERRSFLQGIFGGVAAGGLILKASPKEIERFTAPLAPQQPLVLDPLPVSQPFSDGMFLYNERGERVLEVQSFDVELRRSTLFRINVSGFAYGDSYGWFNEAAAGAWHRGRDPFKA